MVIYLLLLSTLLWRPVQFHRVQSSCLLSLLIVYFFATSLSGNIAPNKGFMLTFDRYEKCARTVLIPHRMAASCVINCGVVAVSIVWKEFCWAATGTDTSNWPDSSRGLLVGNEAGLPAIAGAVFVKNILLSGWAFSLLLCFLKLLWETRPETPMLAMTIFLLLHKNT